MKRPLLYLIVVLILTHQMREILMYPKKVQANTWLTGAESLQVYTEYIYLWFQRQSRSLDWLLLLPGETLEIWATTFISFLHNIYSFSTSLLSSANATFTQFIWMNRLKSVLIAGVGSVYAGTAIFAQNVDKFLTLLAWVKQHLVTQTISFFGLAAGGFYSQFIFGDLPPSLPAAATFTSTLSPLFEVTGLQHIVVVSGFQLSLLARIVVRSLHGLFAKMQVAFLSIGVVATYFFVIGFSIALLRALLMTTAAIFVRNILFRQFKIGHFFVCMLICLAIVDISVFENVSFQLSAAATAGIIYLMPLFTRGDSLIAALERGEIEGKIEGENIFEKYILLAKSSFIVSLCANIPLIPILLYYFGEVRLISIIITSFFFWLPPLLVFIAWVCVIVALAAQVHLIISAFLMPAKYVISGFMLFLETILTIFSQLPLEINVRSFPLEGVILSWLIMLIWVLIFDRRQRVSRLYHRLKL